MKKIPNETKIVKWVILLPIFAVITTSVILINIFISSKYKAFESEVKALERSHIIGLKEKIKERIDHLSIQLNTNYENQIDDHKTNIKNFVYMGHSLLLEVYKNNKHLPKEELYKVIHQKMKDVRFFKDRSGYFFIWNLDDGTSVSLPSAPSLIGTSLVNLTDKKGKRLFDSYGSILKEKGEGFDSWYWNKPNSKVMQEKVGFIKKFEPLNIGIGTAVYVDDVKESISKKSINFIRKLKYIDNSYIFIMNTEGTSLLHKNKEIENVSLEKLDTKIQDNVKNIINKTINSDGSFIEYTQSNKLFEGFQQSKKISYVKHIPILDWIIGTGVYTNDLNKQIHDKKILLEERLNSDIKKLWIVTCLVSIIIIFILIFISKKIKDIIIYYSRKLNISNKALKKLNKNLEKKVSSQVSDIRRKDIILNQQSKLAAMGEMLGNIAHQWRQPLSAISVIASGIKFKRDLGIKDEDQLDKDLVNIVDTTKTLSTTIDDFREFYSDNKELNSININKLVNQVISLVLPNLKNKDIDLIIDVKDITLITYKNELMQALLNIINNAKDELENHICPRYIFINSYKQKNNLIIEISDNAGGIKEDILAKIFDPYFTTKSEDKGTGIGLYMTKKIVDSSLKGKVEVKNKKFTFKDNDYVGACFIIKIPLEIK